MVSLPGVPTSTSVPRVPQMTCGRAQIPVGATVTARSTGLAASEPSTVVDVVAAAAASRCGAGGVEGAAGFGGVLVGARSGGAGAAGEGGATGTTSTVHSSPRHVRT